MHFIHAHRRDFPEGDNTRVCDLSITLNALGVLKTSVSILLTAGKDKWRWCSKSRPGESSTSAEIGGGVSGREEEQRFSVSI